ncbi:nucleoside-diphosphate kinase [Luteococcus sp. OSA5]|uniref:nucleoside-diphosphate kinase n=1 Tax=Luteococcus sp. OSA5 TaxID=3401630 RepID=UPI003B439EEA
MTTERTLVLLKPDAVERGLIGEIIRRYEAKGLSVAAMELRTASAETAQQHYAEHVGRPYYPGLEEFITSGPLVALVLEGERAIEAVRSINGTTDSAVAAPGTIRGDLSLFKNRNLVHASDAPESAAREIGIWFPELAAQ